MASLDSLDDHLAFRTFLIGHDISAADLIVWGALKGMQPSPRRVHNHLDTMQFSGSVKLIGLLKNNKHVHLARWHAHIESLESTQLALASLIGAHALSSVKSSR